jgi:hypothetical protein
MKKAVLLEAKDKESIVVLGVEVVGKPEQLHLIVNGVDLLENIKVSTVQVVLVKEDEE